MVRCSAGYAHCASLVICGWVGAGCVGSGRIRPLEKNQLSCISGGFMKQEKLDGLVTAPAGIDLVSQVQEVTFCNWLEDLSFRKSLDDGWPESEKKMFFKQL